MNKNNKLRDNTNPIGLIMFKWLGHKNSSRMIIGALVIICLLLFLSDFFYHRYGHFAIEEVPGFFAVYGFVMFSIIILGATILRVFLKRSEDYYGNKAVDGEGTVNKEYGDNE